MPMNNSITYVDTHNLNSFKPINDDPEIRLGDQVLDQELLYKLKVLLDVLEDAGSGSELAQEFRMAVAERRLRGDGRCPPM